MNRVPEELGIPTSRMKVTLVVKEKIQKVKKRLLLQAVLVIPISKMTVILVKNRRKYHTTPKMIH